MYKVLNRFLFYFPVKDNLILIVKISALTSLAATMETNILHLRHAKIEHGRAEPEIG